MSLHTALGHLPGDRATESTVRQVLELMRLHVNEPIRSGEVARRLERPESTVSVILSTLSDAYVLRAEGDRFRYDPDPLNDLDVARFLTRAATHSQLVQNNVARFRERYGHH
jgi:DNA-binding IclR family transcriptional regulator